MLQLKSPNLLKEISNKVDVTRWKKDKGSRLGDAKSVNRIDQNLRNALSCFPGAVPRCAGSCSSAVVWMALSHLCTGKPGSAGKLRTFQAGLVAAPHSCGLGKGFIKSAVKSQGVNCY